MKSEFFFKAEKGGRYLKNAIPFLVFVFAAASSFAQKPDALVLYKQGRFKEAAAVCESEIRAAPNNLDSYVVLTWALLSDGQYQKAYDITVAGRNIAQTDPRLIASQAEACYYLGRNTEALKLFEDYISYAPNGVKIPSSYYFMGEIYLRMAKYRHADIALSAAVTLDAVNGLWWSRLGYAREQTRDFRYSLEAYNRALTLNKNLADAQKGKERVLKKF